MEKIKVLSLDRIMELFEEIQDPKRPGGNIRHKLVDLLVIILLGVISGFEIWLEIEDYRYLTWPVGFPGLPSILSTIIIFLMDGRLILRISCSRFFFRKWS